MRASTSPSSPARSHAARRLGTSAAQLVVGRGLVEPGGADPEPGHQLDRPRDEGGVGVGAPAGLGEVVESEGAHGLERAVAPALAVGGDHPPGGEQRGVDETGDHGRGVARGAEAGGQPLGGRQVDAPREHGDGVEQQGVVVGEAAERPGDRVAQRAVAGVGVGSPGLEQVERAVEPGVEVADRERAHPSGRQLEGEGQPVEPPGDVGHEGRVPQIDLQIGLAPAGVGQERVDRGHAGGHARALLGHRQRPDAHEVLGGQTEGLAGRGEQGHPGAGVHQGGAQVAHGGEHVLAVVEDEQGVGLGERVAGSGHEVVAAGAQAECGGDGGGDATSVGDRGQLDQHDRAARVGEVGGRFQRQPGLADAARPDDGDEALGGGPPAQERELVLAADERGGGSASPRPRGGRRRVGRRGGEGTAGGLLLGVGDRPTGVEPGLVDEAAPEVVGRAQRVGLAAGGGEHAHEQGVGGLPQRRVGRGVGGVGDQLGVVRRRGACGVEPGPQPGVGEVPPQLGRRGGSGGERGDVGELGERVAAPQADGRAERGRLVAAGIGGDAVGLGQVEAVGAEVEAVAGPGPFEPVARGAEVSPQARDVAVQVAASGVGQLVGPHGVEQLVGRHRPAAGRGEERQDGPAPRAGDVDRRPVDRDPERAEDVDPQLAAPRVVTLFAHVPVLVACPARLSTATLPGGDPPRQRGATAVQEAARSMVASERARRAARKDRT